MVGAQIDKRDRLEGGFGSERSLRLLRLQNGWQPGKFLRRLRTRRDKDVHCDGRCGKLCPFDGQRVRHVGISVFALEKIIGPPERPFRRHDPSPQRGVDQADQRLRFLQSCLGGPILGLRQGDRRRYAQYPAQGGTDRHQRGPEWDDPLHRDYCITVPATATDEASA